jgi:beta-glucosidase
VKVFKLPSLLLSLTIVLLGGFVYCIQTDTFDPRPRMTTLTPDARYLDATLPIEERVADLLSYMTLEEKIGQMALVEKNSIKETTDIATYHLGALLSGSGAKPENNTAAGWKEMIDGYQAAAVESRLGVPLLYGSDAVHGHAHVPGATVFPHAIGLGATHDAELVRKVAKATAAELEATGVNWSFSPNLDLPRDIRWGRVYEAFSDDSTLVSELGVAYLEGLQGDATATSISVLATPKHYLGLGSMGWNTSLNKNFKMDQGVTPADVNELRAVYLPPFAEAIEAGALSIMVGLNTWGEKRMVLQKELLTDILKDELGYKGFLVSDWYGVHEGRTNTFLATVQAVNAGVDMAMLPFDYVAFTRHMKWANRLGLISDERIDDAVGRILYAKFALGLFDTRREDTSLTSVGSQAHRALAREAVAKSLVLLKNEGTILPLTPSVRHIRVAGSAADNAGRQMGAWSIEWQGVDGNWPEGATSILAGIKARAGAATRVEFDELGQFAIDKKADVGIAVVGEKPYAEGWGDREYPILSDEDLLAIQKLQASCQKVVVVIVSGRPLFIKDEVASWDALVAAWLPGSEGAGVADALFGVRPFTGTLPLPWLSHAEQLPITVDGVTADGTALLYSRYYGLKK